MNGRKEEKKTGRKEERQEAKIEKNRKKCEGIKNKE